MLVTLVAMVLEASTSSDAVRIKRCVRAIRLNCMSLLITGVAGFIGSHVAAKALTQGFSVYGVDDLSSGTLKNVPDGVSFSEMKVRDITPEILLENHVEGILHIAGQNGAAGSKNYPVLDAEINVLQTISLHAAAEKAGITKFVYASSVAVYGEGEGMPPFKEDDATEPLSPYGVGKLSAEKYGHLFQKRNPESVYVALRLHNVYGPGQDINNYDQGIVSIFLGQAINLGCIEVKGRPDRSRDLTYISDCTDAFMGALEVKVPGSYLFNVCTGSSVSVREIVDRIVEWRPGTKVTWGQQDAFDPITTVGDPSRIRGALGWESKVDFYEGLSRTLKPQD